VAMADGADHSHPYIFDRDLWTRGYDITLVAADGYSATFNTADIGPDALYIADNENGKPVQARQPFAAERDLGYIQFDQLSFFNRGHAFTSSCGPERHRLHACGGRPACGWLSI